MTGEEIQRFGKMVIDALLDHVADIARDEIHSTPHNLYEDRENLRKLAEKAIRDAVETALNRSLRIDVRLEQQ